MATNRSRKKRKSREVRQESDLEKLIEDPEAFWVIEKILKKQVNEEGVEEYCVRWEGFSEEWDTWEPKTELMKNAAAMVDAFENLSNPALSSVGRHCICLKPYRFEDGGMIQCSYCLGWFHFKCLKIDMVKANQYSKFFCGACEARNPYAKSKFKDGIKMKFVSFYSESSNDTMWSAESF